MKKKSRILLVDGYNLIGADRELSNESKVSLERARELMLSHLAEYAATSTYEIICVFDAYMVQSTETIIDYYGITVVYTKEKETADDYIERFVQLNYNKHLTEITVVTSDYSEQKTIFGLGALRKSSREMWESLDFAKNKIRKKITGDLSKQPRQRLNVDQQVLAKLEKLRRGT